MVAFFVVAMFLLTCCFAVGSILDGVVELA